MIIELNSPSNQFVLLATHPKSWQVLVLSSIGLVSGDYIKYVEVDSLNVPTGNVLLGLVKWVGSGDWSFNNNSNTIAFCDVISRSVGSAQVGVDLIIG